MVDFIVLGSIGAGLTGLLLLQRRFGAALTSWALIGGGLLLPGDQSLLIGAGVIVLLLGSIGLTRGAIYAGSPRRREHGDDPTIFRDDVHQALADPAEHSEDDVKMDSAMFTHPFWGPD